VNCSMLCALLCLVFGVSAAKTVRPWVFDAVHQSWNNTGTWASGTNFVPSTAVNELEMWQVATYDQETIDKELGYAASLGFNVMRVFLHNLLWEDSETFLATAERFLESCAARDIGVMFVLFDSCHQDFPALGPQPEPVPYLHNSQWVQAPGSDFVGDQQAFSTLQGYVEGVISHFREDARVVAWDLWNEPDSGGGHEPEDIEPLLSQVFAWARAASPTQPLTSPLFHFGPWGDFQNLTVLEQLCITESDVISFHNYGDAAEMQAMVESLQGYGKPLVCTEYMARGEGSVFDPHMGYMKGEGVGAISWGLVSGRTQTIYPWDSRDDPNPYEGVEDPDPWFHDILYPDGTPKYSEETAYIRSLTTA